jgi:hypothetical protein
MNETVAVEEKSFDGIDKISDVLGREKLSGSSCDVHCVRKMQAAGAFTVQLS